MINAKMKDVAEMAGVSISSVSRYISNPESINSIAAVKVAQAIKDLNYLPNPFAQNLKRGNNNTIGIVVPDLVPYFSRACVALNRFFFQNKYLLFICETDDDPDKERYFVTSLIQQRVAGILIASSGKNNDFLKQISKNFTNLVQFDRYEPELKVDAVYEDNIENSYMLTKHMLSKGIRDFTLLFGANISTNTKYRRIGAKKAFHEFDLDIKEMDVIDNLLSPDSIFNSVKEISTEGDKKRCIISYNPLITENTLLALNALGLTIPTDIILAGFALEDFPERFRCNIPLLIQSPYNMGMKSGEVMLKKIKRSNNNRFEAKSFIVDTNFQGMYPEETI